MKKLSDIQRKEYEKYINLSIRVMKGSTTYINNPALRPVLERAAKETGQINFYYANPDLIISKGELAELSASVSG